MKTDNLCAVFVGQARAICLRVGDRERLERCSNQLIIQFFIDLIGQGQQFFGKVCFLGFSFVEVIPVIIDLITHRGVIQEPGDVDLPGGIDHGLCADVFTKVIHPFMKNGDIRVPLKGQVRGIYLHQVFQ